MEDFEARAISTTPNPPGSGLGMWMTPLSSTRQSTPNNSSPTFLPLTPHTVYNRGLQWIRSHPLVGHNSFHRTQCLPHHLSVQNTHTQRPISVITAFPPNIVSFNTLTHKAQTVYSDQELLWQEQQHIRTALNRCNCLNWVFLRLQTKFDFQLSVQDHNTNHSINRVKDSKTNNINIVVPYSKGPSERFKRVCNKVGVQVHFKGEHHEGSANGPQVQHHQQRRGTIQV